MQCSAAEGNILANLARQSCLSETTWHKNLIRAEVLIQLKTVTKNALLPWSIVRYRAILSWEASICLKSSTMWSCPMRTGLPTTENEGIMIFRNVGKQLDGTVSELWGLGALYKLLWNTKISCFNWLNFKFGNKLRRNSRCVIVCVYTGNAQTYEVVETLPPLSVKCAKFGKLCYFFFGIYIRKGRIIPGQARWDYRGREVIAPCAINLNTLLRWVVSLTPRPLYPKIGLH